MAGSGAHIAFDKVSFAYRSQRRETKVLDGVSFTIKPGESVAFIGPSGCGKSTTLHLLSSLLKAQAGTISINGEIIEHPRSTTALIQQDLGLLPWKSALDNVALGLRLRKYSKKEATRRARMALEQVGLSEYEKAWPKELSGGMRQRLAFARALAMEADLLLMDEPLSALDALLRESLQDILKDLWRERGHTQLLVTHSIEEAVYLGGRIIIFSERPARIVSVIENPQVDEAQWRSSASFAEKCQEVRAVLALQHAGRRSA